MSKKMKGRQKEWLTSKGLQQGLAHLMSKFKKYFLSSQLILAWSPVFFL